MMEPEARAEEQADRSPKLPTHRRHSSVFGASCCPNIANVELNDDGYEPDSKSCTPDELSAPPSPLKHPNEGSRRSQSPDIDTSQPVRLTLETLRAVDPLAGGSSSLSLSSPGTEHGLEQLACSKQVSGESDLLALYCSGSLSKYASSSCRLSHSQLHGSIAQTIAGSASHLSHPLATTHTSAMLEQYEDSIGDISPPGSSFERCEIRNTGQNPSSGSSCALDVAATTGNVSTAIPTPAMSSILTPDTSICSIAEDFQLFCLQDGGNTQPSTGAGPEAQEGKQQRTQQQKQQQKQQRQPWWVTMRYGQASAAETKCAPPRAGPISEGVEDFDDDEDDDWGDFGGFEEPSAPRIPCTEASASAPPATDGVDTHAYTVQTSESTPGQISADSEPKSADYVTGASMQTPVATVEAAAAPPQPQDSTTPAVKRFLDALAAVSVAPPVDTSANKNLPEASATQGPFSFPLPDPVSELASLACPEPSKEEPSIPEPSEAATTPPQGTAAEDSEAQNAPEGSAAAPHAEASGPAGTTDANPCITADDTPSGSAENVPEAENGRMHRDAVLRLLGLPDHIPPVDTEESPKTPKSPKNNACITTETVAVHSTGDAAAELATGVTTPTANANACTDPAAGVGVPADSSATCMAHNDPISEVGGDPSLTPRGASGVGGVSTPLSAAQSMSGGGGVGAIEGEASLGDCSHSLNPIRQTLSATPSSAFDELTGGDATSGAASAVVSPRHASAVALSVAAADPFSAGLQALPCSPGVRSTGVAPHVHMSEEGDVMDFAQVDSMHAAGVVTGSMHIDEHFVAAPRPVSEGPPTAAAATGSPVAEAAAAAAAAGSADSMGAATAAGSAASLEAAAAAEPAAAAAQEADAAGTDSPPTAIDEQPAVATGDLHARSLRCPTDTAAPSADATPSSTPDSPKASAIAPGTTQVPEDSSDAGLAADTSADHSSEPDQQAHRASAAAECSGTSEPAKAHACTPCDDAADASTAVLESSASTTPVDTSVAPPNACNSDQAPFTRAKGQDGGQGEPMSPRLATGGLGGVSNPGSSELQTPCLDAAAPAVELQTPVLEKGGGTADPGSQSPRSSGVLDSLAGKLPDLSAVLSPVVVQHPRRSPRS